MPKGGAPGGGAGGGGLGFIVPGRGGGGGRPGKRKGPRLSWPIWGWDFGISIRWGIPAFVFSRRRPAPRRIHPLHFAPPGLPGVIAEICQANPKVCFPPAAGSIGGPFGIAAGAVVAATIWGIQKEAEREAAKKRKRALDREMEEQRARERLNRIQSRVEVSPMQPEFPPYYDFPQPVPLIGRPARPSRAPSRADPGTMPELRPVDIPAPELRPVEFPLPSALPLPEIAPPRPLVRPAAPAKPFEFPALPGPHVMPWSLPFSQPVPLPGFRPGDLPLPTSPLTGFEPVGVPSHLVAPHTFASPQAQPKRGTCECPSTDTKTKKQKRRSKCVKGLYRETRGTIFYTPWAQVDCVTGKEET